MDEGANAVREAARDSLGGQCGPEQHVISRGGLPNAHNVQVHNASVTVGVGVGSHVFPNGAAGGCEEFWL